MRPGDSTGRFCYRRGWPVWVLGGGAAAVLFCGAVLVSTTSYARKETVAGWLSSSAGSCARGRCGVDQ